MILLKANANLKIIFNKLINTMGLDFKWVDIFIINDNNLFLAGKDSVLLFDFGNKTIGFNPVKVNLKEGSIEQIVRNEVLENVLNMTLYVFGKWGKIKGLTVEKDYPQLNKLFANCLYKIKVEPVLTADNFFFYKAGVPITFEKVIQTALDDLLKQEENKESEIMEEEEAEDSKYNIGLWHKIVWKSEQYSFKKEELSESDKMKSRIGNNFYMVPYVCPVCKEKLYMVVYPIGKELLIETDEKAVYIARAYTCNACHHFFTPKPNMLLMEGNVYSLNFEDDTEAYEDYLELIGKRGRRTSNSHFNRYETDTAKEKQDDAVSLERMCNTIDSLSDKEILELQDKMDSDFYPLSSKEKYYIIIVAELKRRRKLPQIAESENDIIDGEAVIRDALAADTALQSEDKDESAVPEPEYEEQKEDRSKSEYGKEENSKKEYEKERNNKGYKKEVNGKERYEKEESNKEKYNKEEENRKQTIYGNKNEVVDDDKGFDRNEENTVNEGSGYVSKADSTSKSDKSLQLQHSKKIENNTMSKRDDNAVNNKGAENSLPLESDKSGKPKDRSAAKNITDIAKDGKRTPKGSNRMSDTERDSDNMGSVTGKLVQHNRLEQGHIGEEKDYDADDPVINEKEKELLRRAETCKEKNYANIMRFMEEVKKEDFNGSLKESIVHSLKELLEKRGKKELDAICLKIPDNISKKQYVQFKDTIEQYRDIDIGAHLKRLEYKRDTAEKKEIAAYVKRTNAKDRDSFMDLYQKLKNEDFEERNVTPYLEDIYDKISDIDEKTIKEICPEPADLTFEEGIQVYEEISSKDLLPELKFGILEMIDGRLTKIKMNECELLVNKFSKDMSKTMPEQERIHLYDVRDSIHENIENENMQIINNALYTYAGNRGKYEFPIVICDASAKADGGRGFILTPDHIYFNTLFEAGMIEVMKIKNVFAHKGMLNTGIYADTSNAGKVKLANSLKLQELEPFINVINDFISYLKEKPESRDVSYMVEEKHSVKCCLRCGYVYKGYNVCPRCGAKFNE